MVQDGSPGMRRMGRKARAQIRTRRRIKDPLEFAGLEMAHWLGLMVFWSLLLP